MLPFVQDERREMAEKSVAAARMFLNCGDCRDQTPDAVRRTWNCGHLPRLPDNRYQGPRLECELEPDTVCPGYLITLPQVIEASHAHVWWEKGQLTEFCDGKQPSRLMRTCVEVLFSASNESQAAAIRSEREKAKRGR